MGGSSKKVTVGYKYYLGMHVIATHGPVDQVTRISFDNRIAWRGRKASGRINLRADNLFGGESREGGISGAVDFEPGHHTQGRNDYLQGKLGSLIPAFRGVAGFVFRQCYLGINPYLKKVSFRLQRIHVRHDGQPQWYNEKSQIGSLWEQPQAIFISLDVSGSMGAIMGNGQTRLANAKTAILAALDYIEELRADTGQKLYLSGVAWANTYLNQTYLNAGTAQVNALKSWFEGLSLGGGTDFREGVASAASFFSSVPEDALRTVLFITDGVPGVAPEGGDSELIATEAATTLFAIDDVWSYAFNIDLADTTYTAQMDNSASDGVPVVSGSDPQALLDALKVALGGQADMNPAHIIRECLTDPDWGMGYAEEDVDDDSFRAAADVLFSEQMGMSLLWDRQIPIESFIQEVVKHIDAALYVSRSTGKFVLKLVRADYDEETLPEFDPSNVEKVDNLSRPAFGELTNSVTVNYWDASTGKEASLTIQDPAMIQMQGAVINTAVQYPGFTNFNIASRVAQRDLRTLSTPLLTCTLHANQDARNLNIGDVFKFSWPDFEVESVVMRVTGLAFGDGKSNKIRVNCTQDVFNLPVLGVITPPEIGWEDPSQPPVPATRHAAFEVPYYELVQLLGQADVDSKLSADPTLGYIGAAAVRPSAASINAVLSINSGAGYVDSAPMDFCPGCTLGDDVDQVTILWPITDASDMDLAAIGSYGKIGSELVRLDAIDLTAGTITVGRGVLDTIPAVHAAGEDILFLDAFTTGDEVEYTSGETILAKVLPTTGQGTLPVDAATADSVTMGSRMIRPYPPAAVTINSLSFPTELNSPLSVAWKTRNRLQQTGGTLIDWFSDSVTPEAGTTYDAILKKASDGTELTSSLDVSGVSTALTSSYNGLVDLVLRAKRDGYASLQDFVHRFQLGVAVVEVMPELRSGQASFTSSNVTSFNATMPAGVEAGDYLILLMSVPIYSQVPQPPAGFVDGLAFASGITVSDGTSSDSYLRAVGKVADGTEGASLTCTISTACSWGCVVLAIKKETYTRPRGSLASRASLSTWDAGAIGHAHSDFSSSVARHSSQFVPYWGGRKAMYLSLLARKQSNDDPSALPFTEFSYEVSSNLSTVPDAKVCGQILENAPATLPVAANDYSKTQSFSATTALLAIRGVFPADRPECIHMFQSSSWGSTVTSQSLATPAGATLPIVGDLQILVMMMFGSSGVTITPPAGFTLVSKFGNRLAVYKRVITGSETYPDTVTFSSAISVMMRLYTFPLGTYDPSAEVLTATTSFASGTTVSCPSRTADSSWTGKQNYAIRTVVRNGVGGAVSNTVSSTGWPTDDKELRTTGFNQGSATERVSFAVAGRVVANEVCPAASFTFLGSVAGEAITIFVKGI